MILGRGGRQIVAFAVASWHPAAIAITAALRLFRQLNGLLTLLTSGRPQQDSNLRSRLRRPLLSPLSYGGPVATQARIALRTDSATLPVSKPSPDTRPNSARTHGLSG